MIRPFENIDAEKSPMRGKINEVIRELNRLTEERELPRSPQPTAQPHFAPPEPKDMSHMTIDTSKPSWSNDYEPEDDQPEGTVKPYKGSEKVVLVKAKRGWDVVSREDVPEETIANQ